MNRKLFLVILLASFCTSAFSQGVPSPATPRLMIDATGKLVSSSNPLPTTATIASATFSASGSMEVYDSRLPVGVTVLATASTAVSTIPIVSGASEILISVIPSDKTIYITLGTTATPAANIGHPVRSSVSIGRLNASEVIKVYAAEDVAIMHTQR